MIFDEPSRKPLPKTPESDDVVHAVKKGFASFVPMGAELFELLTTPLAHRRDDWLEDLARRLRDLEGKVEGFNFDDLGKNEQFVSATLQATQDALRTHQKEKLDALKNAVMNVALGHEPDTDRQQHFLALIDRFSDTHLILLRFFKEPTTYFQRAGRPIPMVHLPTVEPVRKLLAYQLVTDAMPSLSQQLKSPLPERSAAFFQFVESVLGDLVFAKLIALDRLNDTWSVPKFDRNPEPTPVKPLITHLGEDFLAFITEPREEAA